MCFGEPAPVKQRYGISTTTFTPAQRSAQLFQPVGGWPAWRILIETAIQIMPSLTLLRIERGSGICQGQRSSQALMDRPFPVAGSWRLQPILTAAANRTMYFTIPARGRRRYGISTTTFSSAARMALLFPLAGAWSRLE